MATGSIEELAQALASEFPDPVDRFEDLLADLLGFSRHPTLSYADWRKVRVELIEAEGERADNFARRGELILEANVGLDGSRAETFVISE